MASFTISKDRDTVTVVTDELELAFSTDDGGLRRLQRRGGPNMLGFGEPRPSVDVQVGLEGTWLAERVFVRYLSHRVDQRETAVELTIVIGIGPLMVYDRYRMTGTLIARRVSVENVSEDEIQLRHVRLSLPWAQIGDGPLCRFEAPGNGVRPGVPLSIAAGEHRGAPPRRFFAPSNRDGRALLQVPNQAAGLLAVHNPQLKEALLCWYYGEGEPAQPQIDGNGTAVTLTHELQLADWLRSEVALSGGTQYILLLHESWPGALSAFQRTMTLVGFRSLPQPAAWVRDAAIYETHPAESGGFAGLTKRLDALQAMGINTLCLLPIWVFENRKGRLWDANWQDSGNPYAIRDFEQIDPTLGTPEDLSMLVEQAHARRMRVLVDLPLAGCAASSDYVTDHPEWFCRDEAAEIIYVPGGDRICAFDWANHGLQAYMLTMAVTQAQRYRIDGYRILPSRTTVINWTRRQAAHASMGSLGALRWAEQLRYALAPLLPNPAILNALGGPLCAPSSDLITDELAHYQFFHLGLERITPNELGAWLSDHLRMLPADLARVCFTESYTTHILNPIADGLRGSLISRMLFAGMLLCGFVPLIRAGQETSDEAFITALLRARAEQPILRYGRTLYNRALCSNVHVFVVLRQTQEQRLLGLLNVSAQKNAVTCNLPVEELELDDQDYVLRDVLNGRCWMEEGRKSWRLADLAALTLTLEPFGAYCLLLQPAPPEELETPPSIDVPDTADQSLVDIPLVGANTSGEVA